MKIDVIRYDGGASDTRGKMYIDGKYVCYTLEDEYREVKVRRETRIPQGKYNITLRTEGGFHQRYAQRFQNIHQGMLWVRNVPNFDYILIHTGNTEDHTAGCILVGDSTGKLGNKRAVLASTKAYKRIYPVISDALLAGENVDINVIDEDREPNNEIDNIEKPLPDISYRPRGSRYTWILDNGHGTDTPGKRSPVLPDGNQLFEYEFNRHIVSKIVSKLQSKGINYHVLVPESYDVSLTSRAKKANALKTGKPKMLISVHGNAAGNGDWYPARGLETFHYPSSQKGEDIAKVFQGNITNTLQLKDRGVKSANFALLRRSLMPAILTENGFFTHLEECKKMISTDFQDKIADAHVKAIEEIERNGI